MFSYLRVWDYLCSCACRLHFWLVLRFNVLCLIVDLVFLLLCGLLFVLMIWWLGWATRFCLLGFYEL